MKFLTGDLLVLGKNGNCFAYLKRCTAGYRINSVYLCSDKFLILALELFKLLISFRFFNTLTDDMLCVLCNNSAELLCFKRNINSFSNLCRFTDLLSILKENICIGILYFINNIFSYVNFNLFLFRVNIAMNYILAVIIVLCRNNDSRRDFIIKIISRNILFLNKKLYGFKNSLLIFPINLSYLLKSFISKSSSFTNDVSFLLKVIVSPPSVSTVICESS